MEFRGHGPIFGGSGYSDWINCTCGWKSRSYWDGREYAYQEWQEHATTAVHGALITEGIGL